MAASLPEGWGAYPDPTSGRTYYGNPYTGQSQWEPPEVDAGPLPSLTAPLVAQAPLAADVEGSPKRLLQLPMWQLEKLMEEAAAKGWDDIGDHKHHQMVTVAQQHLKKLQADTPAAVRTGGTEMVNGDLQHSRETTASLAGKAEDSANNPEFRRSLLEEVERLTARIVELELASKTSGSREIEAPQSNWSSTRMSRNSDLREHQATIDKEAQSQLPRSQAQVTYSVSNATLQAETPGLYYHPAKRLDHRIETPEGLMLAPWSSLVDGIDEGDGWLRVGLYYLPMRYNGADVLLPWSVEQSIPHEPLNIGEVAAKCSLRHPRKPTERQAQWRCDGYWKMSAAGKRLRCHSCDHDLCAPCYSKAASRQSQLAEQFWCLPWCFPSLQIARPARKVLVPDKACDNCGHMFPADAIFCRMCGKCDPQRGLDGDPTRSDLAKDAIPKPDGIPGASNEASAPRTSCGTQWFSMEDEKADGALLAGPMAAVAALWGSDEPFLEPYEVTPFEVILSLEELTSRGVPERIVELVRRHQDHASTVDACCWRFLLTNEDPQLLWANAFEEPLPPDSESEADEPAERPRRGSSFWFDAGGRPLLELGRSLSCGHVAYLKPLIDIGLVGCKADFLHQNNLYDKFEELYRLSFEICLKDDRLSASLRECAKLRQKGSRKLPARIAEFATWVAATPGTEEFAPQWRDLQQMCSNVGVLFPRAVVLVTTREAARSVASDATCLGAASCPLDSSLNAEEQMERLYKELPALVVSTPGDLRAFIRGVAGHSEPISLEKVTQIVLDDADRLLELGFEEDLRALLNSPRHKHHVTVVRPKR